MDIVMDIRPSDIHYSQDSISKYFDRRSSHGSQTIGQTLDQIIVGKCSISNIPKISVLKLPRYRDKWFSVDNRRLWVFKHLERLGYLVTIEVNCTIFNTYLHGRKITTNNGGVSVRIRGDGNPEGTAHSLPDNCYTVLKPKIEKARKDGNKQQKQDSDTPEPYKRATLSRKQSIETSSREQRKAFQIFTSQRSTSTARSDSSKYNTLPSTVPHLHNDQSTTNPSRSLVTYFKRDRDTSYGENHRNIDREIKGCSARFQTLNVTDPVKVSQIGSDSSNKEDIGTSINSRSNRCVVRAFEMDDDQIKNKNKASYQVSYQSKVGYTLSESKPSTRNLAPSHDRYKVIHRDEQRHAVSPDNGTKMQAVEEQAIQIIQENRSVPRGIVSDAIRTREIQATRDKPSPATIKDGFVATRDGRSLSVNSKLDFGYTSSISTQMKSHKVKIHISYCTEEEVEKNMKLLLHRQRYKDLYPDTWSTVCYKSGH